MSTGLKANNDGSAAIQVGGSDFLTVTSGGNTTFTQAANLPNTFGFKNRIINGAMVIDQRNAGAVYTSPASNTYQLDRWVCNGGGGGFNVQQNSGSVTPPSGFANYYGVVSTSTTAASNYNIRQFIEGFNTADLMFGTANAQTITLSFWVRSSLTGTFGGAIQNSAGNRSYVYSYTINSANTWEYKTVTIPGDTSGTWIGATNGAGLVLFISYSVAAAQTGSAGSWTGNDYRAPTGQINVVGTNGATFYITGVQLEKGSTATSFDFRSYGTELALCQRYYEKSDGNNTSLFWSGNTTNTATYYFALKYAVTKRATPTTTISNISNSQFPNTIVVGIESTVGFRADSTSNATAAAGFFRADWASSAEL